MDNAVHVKACGGAEGSYRQAAFVKPCLHERFVGRQLYCIRCQTKIDDVFTQPTSNDGAISIDLDIHWRELTDAAVMISKMNGRNEFI